VTVHLFSEAQFKTTKYWQDYPERFEDSAMGTNGVPISSRSTILSTGIPESRI